MPIKVVTTDGGLEVYQARYLNSRVISRVPEGVEIRLGDLFHFDGRDWIEATLEGGAVGYVLAPSARGHTTFGAMESDAPSAPVEQAPMSCSKEDVGSAAETKLAELRRAQAGVRKALRMLLLTNLAFPVLFVLFVLVVLAAPLDDDTAALLLAEGVLLPVAIAAVIWRQTGAAQRSLRRDIASGVLRPIRCTTFPHVQELVRKTQVTCGLQDLKLNLLYSRSASPLPSVASGRDGACLIIPAGFIAVAASDERVAMAMLAHECAHIVHQDTEFWQAVQARSTVMLVIFRPLLYASVPFEAFAALLGVLSGGPATAAIGGLGMRVSQIRILRELRRELRRGRQLSEELADLFAYRNSDRIGLTTAIHSLTTEETRSGVIGAVHPEKGERLKLLIDVLAEASEGAGLSLNVTPLRVRASDRLRQALREMVQRRRRALFLTALIAAIVAGAVSIMGRWYGIAAADIRYHRQVILYARVTSPADLARLYAKPVLIRIPSESGGARPGMLITRLLGRPGDRVRALEYRLYVNDRVLIDRSSERPNPDYVPDFAQSDPEMKARWQEMSRDSARSKTFWDRFPPDWPGWHGSPEQDSMLNLPRQGDAIVLPPDGYFVDGSFSSGLIKRSEILGDPTSVLWSYHRDGWSSVIFRVDPSAMFAPPRPQSER